MTRSRTLLLATLCIAAFAIGCGDDSARVVIDESSVPTDQELESYDREMDNEEPVGDE